MFQTTVLIVLFTVIAAPAAAQDRPTEPERIRTHLLDVEAELRSRDVSRLSAELRAARAANIESLHDYAIDGLFPRNLDYPGERVPYFFDDRGVPCAVAYLMVESGHDLEAREISAAENNAWLLDMTSPQVGDWVAQSGLTAEEAQWIQPTYNFCDSPTAVITGPSTASCGETISLSASSSVTDPACFVGYQWSVAAGAPEPAFLAATNQVTAAAVIPSSLTVATDFTFKLRVTNGDFDFHETTHTVAVPGCLSSSDAGYDTGSAWDTGAQDFGLPDYGSSFDTGHPDSGYTPDLGWGLDSGEYDTGRPDDAGRPHDSGRWSDVNRDDKGYPDRDDFDQSWRPTPDSDVHGDSGGGAKGDVGWELSGSDASAGANGKASPGCAGCSSTSDGVSWTGLVLLAGLMLRRR